MSTHAPVPTPRREVIERAGDLPSATAPDLATVTERLMFEFEGQIGLDTISRAVRDSDRDLAGAPGETQPELVERSARQRLTDHVRRIAAS